MYCKCLIQFIFGFYNNFSGQTIIDDWFITLFNLLFTSLPLGVRACLDFDVIPSDGAVVGKMLPFLYSELRESPIFTKINFGLTLLKGVIHCILNFFYVVYVHKNHSIDNDGNIGGLWFVSANMFTNILVIVSIDLIILTKYETWINWVILGIITGLAYAIFLIIVHFSIMFNSVGTMGVAFSSPSLWLTIIFIGGICFIIDFAIVAFNFNFRATMTNILQAKRNQGLLNEDMPPKIKEKLAQYDIYKKEQIQVEVDKITVHVSDKQKKINEETSKIKSDEDNIVNGNKPSLKLEEKKTMRIQGK